MRGDFSRQPAALKDKPLIAWHLVSLDFMDRFGQIVFGEPVTAEELEWLREEYNMDLTFQNLSELTGINRDPVTLADIGTESGYLPGNIGTESGYLPGDIGTESGHLPGDIGTESGHLPTNREPKSGRYTRNRVQHYPLGL
jgi:hypothetical protein